MVVGNELGKAVMEDSSDFCFGVEVDLPSRSRHFPSALVSPAVAIKAADLGDAGHVLKQVNVSVRWLKDFGRDLVQERFGHFVFAVDHDSEIVAGHVTVILVDDSSRSSFFPLGQVFILSPFWGRSLLD